MPNDEVIYDDELQLNLAEYGNGEALGLGKTWIVMERELAGLRRRIRDIENLERQNSQVAIRANSQSSSLQNRLKATEEKFDLSVNVLNSCKSIMTSMQGQLEAKDAQLGVLINRSNELIDEFNQLQVVNATNAANLANTQTYLNEVRNELQNRSQQLITLAETHNNLRVEKAQSDTRAEFFSGQVVRTENELQTTKTNLEEVRERLTNLVIAEKDKENDLKTILMAQEIEKRGKEYDLQGLRRELNKIKQELEERISPTDLQTLLFTHETEIREKEQEIETKSREIANLRERLGQSQEQSLNLELRAAEEEVEELANHLRINWERIRDLRNSYELLIRARKNNEQNNIRTSQNDIEAIRQDFLQDEISISDVRRICRLCEQVAELRLNQQQFEAHIQVPPRRY